jgi:hypothetical protein
LEELVSVTSGLEMDSDTVFSVIAIFLAYRAYPLMRLLGASATSVDMSFLLVNAKVMRDPTDW